MNNIFDKIFVIHLKKNKNRLYNFKKTIGNKIKFSIFYGIETNKNEINTHFDWKYYLQINKDLSYLKTQEQAIEHYNNFGKEELRVINEDTEIVNKGQLGCLLSHLEILKYAKKNKLKKILILEDDIRLHKDLLNNIRIVNLIPEWKMLYLGGAQDNWSNIKIEDTFYYSKETRGTFAYAIKYDFYDKLIELFEGKRKPVDRYLIDLQKNYKIPVIYPNLIVADLSESNISGYRNNNIWFKRFRWNKYDYYKNNKIIILILTCQKKLIRQNIIRKTYLKDIKKLGYEYYFVLNKNTNNDIYIEGDILYINMEDLYENLPKKVLNAYQYLYKNRDFDYIYKIDDDVIVNFHKLDDMPYYNYEYYGKMIGGETFDRNSHKNKVSNKSIWYNKEYDKSYYGKWCGGGFSYFLSNKAIKVIVENSKLILNDLLEDKGIGDTLKLFGGEEFDILDNNDMSRFICNYYKINIEKDKIIYFEVEEEDMEKVYYSFHK